MSREVVVVGAGGFGRETLDVLEAAIRAGAGLRVLGVIDSNPSDANLGRLRDREVSYLGTEDGWLDQGRTRVAYLVGVGSTAARERIVRRFDGAGLEPISVIHPAAVVGSQSAIEAGTVICAGVQISTNVTIGRHVHVNPGAIVGHDAVLEDCVSVNPAAVVSGEASVGRGALIGAGAVILQGRRVGAGAIVGAAACVVHDVESGAVVKGVPAR
jgi:hypothetical protein